MFDVLTFLPLTFFDVDFFLTLTCLTFCDIQFFKSFLKMGMLCKLSINEEEERKGGKIGGKDTMNYGFIMGIRHRYSSLAPKATKYQNWSFGNRKKV